MRTHDNEDFDAKLTAETRAQFAALTRAVLAGEQPATKRITDALGDYLGDDNAFAELVRGALTSQGAFRKVLDDVIWTEAEALAEVDVAGMERSRAESAQHNRIEQRVWDRFFSRSAA